jgi:hypothetical protein
MQWPETDSTWASVVTDWWLIAWVTAVSLKMLITVPLCSMIIICDLTYYQICSFVVLCHSAHVDHVWIDSTLTLYCIACLKCPSNHTLITADKWSVFTSSWTDYRSIWRQYDYRSIWRQYYCHRTWKTKTVPLQVTQCDTRNLESFAQVVTAFHWTALWNTKTQFK